MNNQQTHPNTRATTYELGANGWGTSAARAVAAGTSGAAKTLAWACTHSTDRATASPTRAAEPAPTMSMAAWTGSSWDWDTCPQYGRTGHQPVEQRTPHRAVLGRRSLGHQLPLEGQLQGQLLEGGGTGNSGCSGPAHAISGRGLDDSLPA